MTQLLVLGLLKKGALSGYDIQIMLQTSDAESWGGVLVGSIYHALKKLEKDNYITISSIEKTGRRQKAIYEITKKGIEYFNKLLINSLQNNSISYPTQLYSGLNFIHSLDNNQVISALLLQKENLKKELSKLNSAKIEKKKYIDKQLSPISELVFEHMITTLQQQIEFIDKVIQIIS